MTVGELKKKLSEYPDDMTVIFKKLFIEKIKDLVQEFGDACYERGGDDACDFEYGRQGKGNISFDEFIKNRNKTPGDPGARRRLS